MQEIIVSVIVPVYNVEQYVVECLDSVLKQAYPNIEIICIEDCSTDGSKAIVQKYMKRNDNIKLLCNEENLGLSASRNVGLKNAIGKYVMFLDSDDFLKDSDVIDRLVTYAETNRLDVLSFDMDSLNECNTPNDFNGKRMQKYPADLTGVEACLLQKHNQEYKTAACQSMYRKDFLEKNQIRFLEGVYHEDMLFSLEVYLAADRATCLNETVYVYRKRENSITHNNHLYTKRIADLCKIYQVCAGLSDKYIGCSDVETVIEFGLEEISKLVRNYYFCASREQRKLSRELLQNGFQRNLFDLIVKKNMVDIVTKGEERILRESNQLYLYGAGGYAKKWIIGLMEKNITLDGIVVSELNGNPESVFGYRVFTIDDLCATLKEPITIIIGVSNRYKDEVKEQLKKYEMVQVFSVENERFD